MRGCLFTLALGVLVLALVVVVGLPGAAAGVLTAGVTAAGLRADDTRVDVTTDPPTDLLAFRADRVRVRATEATFRDLEIDAVDIVMDDVGLLARSAARVDGRLSGVTVPDVGGAPLRLAAIRLGGGGETITATTAIPRGDAERILAGAISSTTGIRPDAVRLGPPDRVVATFGPAAAEGRFVVTEAGDLVIRVVSGPVAGEDLAVLRAGSDLPMRLTGVAVDASGLVLDGVLTFGLLG